MTTENELLTRDDIARLLRVDIRTVRRNEARWGLIGCKVTLTRNIIRYRKLRAMRILTALGVIE